MCIMLQCVTHFLSSGLRQSSLSPVHGTRLKKTARSKVILWTLACNLRSKLFPYHTPPPFSNGPLRRATAHRREAGAARFSIQTRRVARMHLLGDAVLVVPQAVKDQLPEALAGKSLVMKNGDSIEQHGFTITAIPMYNVPESPEAFHIKGRGNGYLIERDGTRLYVAGDTGGTPEMR